MHLPLVFCLVSGVLAEKHLVIVSLSSDDYYEKFVDDIAKFANDLAGSYADSCLYMCIIYIASCHTE